MTRSVLVMLGCVLLLVVGVMPTGCTSNAKVAPRALDVPVISRDTPEVLGNTVGAFGQINGLQPQYVSGYGLVVGLNGTGSGDAPLSVRALLMDEMTRNGVGMDGTSLADATPDQVLDDPNTAVVLVQAIIPPAAPRGQRFDVRVNALPGSSTTSLEGGRLFTTELRRGTPIPGGRQSFVVARARGPIMINPLVAPQVDDDELPRDDVVRTVGRILSGGTVNSPFRPTYRLDNPSHARSRAITQAINTRFPQGSARAATARGMNEDSIELNVPREFLDDPDRFFSLVLHTRVDQTFSELWAERYVRALEEQPLLSQRIGWALEALGDNSINYVRRLYDAPDRGPRLAGLRVGARLGDPLTRPHLEELALDGPKAQRINAIELLAMLPFDRRIDIFLGEQLDDEDLSIRIAAYEALEERADPRIVRMDFLEKYAFRVVPSSYPMIYFTQSASPKLVVFSDIRMKPDAFATAWDDRLMIDTSGDLTATGTSRVFYQDYRTGESSVHTMSDSVRELIEYFAHDSTPERPWPGIGLSYSETISALYELTDSAMIDADFVAENDRLQLDFLRAAEAADAVRRPELSDDGPIGSLAEVQGDTTIVATFAGDDRDERVRERDEDWQARRLRYVVPGPAASSTASGSER